MLTCAAVTLAASCSYPALVISLGISSQQVRIIQSRWAAALASRLLTLRGAHRAHGQNSGRRLSGPRTASSIFSRQQQPRLGPHYDCELALKRDGTIAGMKMQLVDDLGAFPNGSPLACCLSRYSGLGSCYHVRQFDYSCKAS